MNVINKIKAYLAPSSGVTDLEQNLRQALRGINSDVEYEDSDDGRYGTFDFQGGKFVVRFPSEGSHANIVYPCCYECDMANIANLRSTVNHVNHRSDLAKAVYALEADEHKIQVHIVMDYFASGNLRQDSDTLVELLTKAFSTQRYLHNVIDGMSHPGTGYEEDVEFDNAKLDRVHALLREYEQQNQDDNFEVNRLNPNEPETLKIKDVMCALGATAVEYVGIGAIGCDAPTADFANFDLKSIMSQGVADVTLAITFHDLSDHGTVPPRQATLRLLRDLDAGSTHYYRLTACLTPYNLDSNNHLGGERNKLRAFSVLIAYDETSPKKMMDEYNFMVLDMQDKVRDNKASELTDEQGIMSFLVIEAVSYSLYWGATRFRQKRYIEAIPYLREAHEALNASPSCQDNESYHKVCYMLGFCYLALNQPVMANYYLSKLVGVGRISYAKAFVDSLVKLADRRGIDVIDNIMPDLADAPSDDDEEDPEPEHIADFRFFLLRSKVMLFTKLGEWEKARDILQNMRKVESQREYAERELARINDILAPETDE